ncbi:NAC domain-containing protein 5-like isoform X2 [Citrus sinensis]|uniref:NAC domain-containing protein 5-like isoform X2 n=1 Tax=Citrus sinensis TaxID=2711 RepID=UPI000D62C0F2|nr:NAC domain-containing protein 5-like isoform X2 [Citrus sinensis]
MHLAVPNLTDGHSEIQGEEEVWYYYCEHYYKYAKSKRAHRRTKSGYWKVTGTGSDIKRKNSTEVIGTKKIWPFGPVVLLPRKLRLSGLCTRYLLKMTLFIRGTLLCVA